MATHRHDHLGAAIATRAGAASDRQETSGAGFGTPRRTDWPSRTFFWIYVAVAGSLLLRLSVFDFESGDYHAFLSPWYDHFIEHGRWNGLGDFAGSYPPLYLYLLSLSTVLPLTKLYAIKLISILCDYLAAWFVFRIVGCAVAPKKDRPSAPLGSVERVLAVMPWAAGLGMLYLPTVWFNSAVWGQCDSMFTAALLAAFYFTLINRPVAALVAFGLAGSLKPQAIFLAPFLGGMFFRERWRWRWLLIPALVYMACGLPAVLAGKPFLEMLFHWGRQRNMAQLTLGAPNWYQWIANEYYAVFYLPGIVLTLVGTVFLILAMQDGVGGRSLASLDEGKERGTRLTAAALLSVLMVPYLLPGMHERYFYPADVFSLVYAFVVPGGWVVAALVQFCSFFSYLPYLFQEEPVPRPLLAILMTVAVALVGRGYVKGWLRREGRGEALSSWKRRDADSTAPGSGPDSHNEGVRAPDKSV
jgi:Gpi18-like mannosyltransferase